MKKVLISLTFILFIFLGYSQSCHNVKELLRKRHTISGMTYGHPYTTFDRHNKLSLDSTIANIRTRIIYEKGKPKTEAHIYVAYQAIYDNASKPYSTFIYDNGMPNTGVSQLAYWAKNNAFVFLVGMDANGNLLDTPTYTASRDSFRDRALNAFTNLRREIEPHFINNKNIFKTI